MSDPRTEPLLRLVDDSMKPLYEGRVEVECDTDGVNWYRAAG